jgi:FkbM family methyltransferase
LYSNTFLLYQRGWSGLHIDARQGLVARFEATRPRDKFIEAAVGDGSEIVFVDFEGAALSGVDSPLASERESFGARVLSRRTVRTIPLADLLAAHLPDQQPIDLLSVDIEGAELTALTSNDWTRFRPRVVIAEIGDAVTFADAVDSPVATFLTHHGYAPYAKTGLSVFFADVDLLQRSPFGFEVMDRNYSRSPIASASQ